MTGSDVLMLRDMLYLHRLQIPHNSFTKISLVRRQASQCAVCTMMTILATFKNIMKQKGYSIDTYVAHVLPRMVRSVFTVPWIAKQKFKKRLTLGIVDKATWQPDCFQKDDVNCHKNKMFLIGMCLIVLFVGKLYLLNVPSRREWTGWSNVKNSYKPVVSVLFADVIRDNLGHKGHGQARPLVGTQVVSKPGEPLALFKEDVKLSYNAHHALKKKARS